MRRLIPLLIASAAFGLGCASLAWPRVSQFVNPYFFGTALWALCAWHVAREDERYRRFVEPGTGRVAAGAVTGLGILFFSDLFGALAILPFVPVALGAASIVVAADPKRPVSSGAPLALGSAVLSLTAAELFFRAVLLLPVVPVSEEGIRSALAASWSPGSAEGPRDRGGSRLLGIADSFGVGKRNYHDVIEESARAQGFDVDVINLSLPELGLADELEMLRRHGSRFGAPHLVLHGVFVGNDFTDGAQRVYRFAGVSVRSGGLGAISRPRLALLREWLGRYSIVARDRTQRAEEGASGERVGFFSRSEFLRIQRNRLARNFSSHPSRVARESVVEGLLDSIRHETGSLGARYVMVIHPDRVQVDPGTFDEVVRSFDLDPAAYDLDLPQKFLRRYCERHDLVCVDLLPDLRRASDSESLYQYRETHYEPVGHALVARLVVETLRERSLLGGPEGGQGAAIGAP